MTTIAAVTRFLESFALLRLAEEWDNVGLLLGDPAASVDKIMTCLTVTPETAAEAIDKDAQLIVSHHPILFRGVKRLTTALPEEEIILRLVRANVAVFSPHTAFDNTNGGINDQLAKRLELKDVQPLVRKDEPGQCKIVVFVPEKDLSKVSDALFSAGAGQIGQYSQCSFRLAGTGTFFGSEATNPTVGEKGRREEVNEYRLEVICPAKSVERAVAAMRSAHSYEEPAFDVYPLRPSRSTGVGRIGILPEPLPLYKFAGCVKDLLRAASIQFTGDRDHSVRRVAIVCGAGGEFWKTALHSQADVLLTGEARYHDCLAASARALALVLPGHHSTERPGVEELARRLQEAFPKLTVWASAMEYDPLQSV